MSNNPLEAVTQAVNSLVTALKLPDESAKANEVLGEMSFPQFSRLLPYRDYNQESGLFMNDTTMGFMLEAIPINGANESIVEALDHMLRTKLPRGVPFCIHLMSSQLVGDRIEYGLREFSWSGEQAERFNAITVPPAVIPVPISPSHRTSSTLTLTRPPVRPVQHGVTPPTKLSSNRVRRSSRNTTSCNPAGRCRTS